MVLGSRGTDDGLGSRVTKDGLGSRVTKDGLGSRVANDGLGSRGTDDVLRSRGTSISGQPGPMILVSATGGHHLLFFSCADRSQDGRDRRIDVMNDGRRGR